MRHHRLLRLPHPRLRDVWISAGNELDLIVRRGLKLAFVEVKGKSGTGFGDPLEMVTPEKQRRIRRAAVYLAGRAS